MTLAAGTRLGPYEIQSAIGASDMREAYEARETRLDRTVAIMVLRPTVAADRKRRVRFEREAETIASLEAIRQNAIRRRSDPRTPAATSSGPTNGCS